MSAHAAPTAGASPDRARGVRGATATPVRPAAFAGFVFFALILVHAQLRSGAPAASDSAREVVDFLARHHDRLQADAVALGFAMPAALVWLSGLLLLLRDVEGRLTATAIAAFAGGTLVAAGAVTAALIEGATATRYADLGAGGARAAWTLFEMSTGAMLLGLLLLVGATTVVSARTELFARWLTPAGGVLVAVSLAGAFTIGYATDAIQVVAGIAVLLDSIWILLVSLFMWRRRQRAG